MPKLKERGAIQFVVLLILLAGIVGVVYLVTQGPLKIFPKAGGGISQPIYPNTSFTLSSDNKSVNVGDLITVKLEVRSDVAAANLFDAKIKFDNSILAVDKIDTTNKSLDPSFTTFITSWVEEFSDNNTGEISLVGGVPNPGYQTISTNPPSLMATIYFKALRDGNTTISFTDASAIYSNANNTNILVGKDPITISLSSGVTPIPTASPPGGVKCSALFSRIQNSFNKQCGDSGYDKVADLNKDKIITILDFSLLSANNNNESWCSQKLADNNDPCVSIACPTPPPCKGQLIVGDPNPSDQNQCPRYSCLPATPSPSPVATPLPGTGDGNNDGKINLVDLSVLLTDFNKTKGFRTSIDLNGDGVINSFDFSLMRNLLIANKVIRGS